MTAPQTSPSPANANNDGAGTQSTKQNLSVQVEGTTKTNHEDGANTLSPTQLLQKPSPPSMLQKKVSRRSSKPIINWLQRKLAGSGKAKRTENHPLTPAQSGTGRNNSNSSRQMGRIVSSPLPVPAVQHLKQQSKPDLASIPKRKTRSISLKGDDEPRRQSYGPEDDVSDQFSLNRDSIYSPASALEADDDASVRPLPPSAPPSPSPSRDSSSYLSDPRTFRSIAASTKPTTLLSIDLNGGGMAHIAEVPQAIPIHRFTPHVRQTSFSGTGVLNSGASVTFSALPNTSSSSQPSSIRNADHIQVNVSSVQAPLHTTPHPRNNPRPSSPPLDNASILTLASSAFALSNRPGIANYPPSATLGDAVSHYGGSIHFPDAESTSHYVLGDDERLEDRDFDASVRALRPRSSRRGSWESEASGWSARVQGGTPSLSKAFRTSGSIQTGGFSTENTEVLETTEGTPATATLEIEESDSESRPNASVPPEEVVSTTTPTDDTSSNTVSDTLGINNSEVGQVLHPPSIDTVAQCPSPPDDPPAVPQAA